MRVRFIVVALVAIFAASAATASAQSQTGEIFGKVTDQSNAVLPGVMVTVTGPVLLQPLTAVTSPTGTFQFPRVEIGTYSVKFELTGFKTIVREGIVVTVGFSAAVNIQMGISTVQETVTVVGESPIVDTKATGTKQTFTNDQLQNIPSARDPWVILQQTAGIAMDRENVGGNMSGQQSAFISRGGGGANAKWALDGVDITDLASQSSPSYYDFDAFQEMTITTGGVDVTQQTGGVGINLVTKSGSDKFRGSGRYYVTDQRFESQNITDAMRLQGASAGNPIQNIKDFGTEMGGPLKKGRAWIWGSYGKQFIDVGVLGFYQPTAACLAIKADEAANALAHPISDVNNCLNTDETLLQTTNLKAEVQLFTGNKLTLFNNFAKKVRNARGASDINPIETTTPQADVNPVYGVGRNWWTIGPNPTFKFGDQWVVSDRLLLDVQYGHVGNNFILDFHSPSLATVQPTLIIPSGLNGRSGTQSIFLRPENIVNFNANYFLPGKMGGDHSFKVGGYWRDNYSYSASTYGGNATDRFPTNAEAASSTDCATLTTGCQVDMRRNGLGIYDLKNVSVYGQDTFKRDRLTLQLGVRYDRNHDTALPASVAANVILPSILPAVSFAGVDPGIVFNNFSPRLGFTYDMKGDGLTVFHANYAYYYGQLFDGAVASQLNPVSAVAVRYQWLDANHDGVAQAGELYDKNGVALVNGGNPALFLNQTGNWNPANPGSPTTSNTVDPNLKNDTTAEVIIGVDHQIGAGFAVGGNYIWRRYANFNWTPTNGVPIDGTGYSAVQFTPAASACPAAQNAYCPQVTYYQPNAQLGTVTTLMNQTGFTRVFNGVDLTARKRMSHHWMMDASYSFNNPIVNYGTGSYQDPSNIAQRNGYQYDPVSSGSGIGNVYTNAKWLFKLGGMYQAPFGFNVSAFYNARQGYPFERFVLSPSRANGAGTVSVLLDNVGTSRLPNYQNLDFHVERPVKLGTVRLIPAIDVFNISNGNTVQAIRGTQNSSIANNIQATLAPRVMRAGLRITW